MSSLPYFYDAAAPAGVPSGSYAACYINGYAWTEADMKRMARIFRISVFGDAHYARLARCIDIETHAATPADAVPFARYRRALGHDDVTCYVNRSNYWQVRENFDRAGEKQPLYWVATLDGTIRVPGAWAVQFETNATGGWDKSILHGEDNFVKP